MDIQDIKVIKDKIYYHPGDKVTIKHDIPNKPIMLIVSKESKMIKSDNSLIGFKCQWFSTDMKLQFGIFSSKDLIHV